MKFKLICVLFVLVVASGVSVALSEFNRMVYIPGGARAFKVDYVGPGCCQAEFLGEKIKIELPAAMIGFNPREEALKVSESVKEASLQVKITGGQVLKRTLAANCNFASEKITVINNRLSVLADWFYEKAWNHPVDG